MVSFGDPLPFELGRRGDVRDGPDRHERPGHMEPREVAWRLVAHETRLTV
jgi:hypothetical protein